MSAHEHAGGEPGHADRRRLALTLLLVVLYMGAEVVGGILTGSLALLADAGHMFSDAAALGLSLFALWFATRPAGPAHTFGYHRSEILAALANGAALVAISVYIFIEAFQRLGDPPEVQGGLMVGIAFGGLVVNALGLLILRGGREGSLNVRGAWLHVLADLLGSVQALAAGALIWAFGWNWTDPVASVLIGVLVVFSAWSLLRDSVAVLMQRAPRHIDVVALRQALCALEGVVAVEDLHVWTLTSGKDTLSAHVVVADPHPHPRMLRTVQALVRERFAIEHVTVQLEPRGFDEPRVPF